MLFLPAALRSGELVASPLSALTPHARRVAVIIREAGRAASVEWRLQRDAAKRAVQNITGVRGVTNEITVKSRPKIADLRHRWLPLLIRDRPRDAGSRLCSLA